MVNYQLDDAIHEKNILYMRAIHASRKVPQSPILLLFIMNVLGMQTFLYELEI